MKYFISILLLSLCSLSSAAEYGQLAPDTDYNTLRLEAGDVLEVLAYNTPGNGNTRMLIFMSDISYTTGDQAPVRIEMNTTTVSNSSGNNILTFVGPGVLEAIVPLHYKLTRAPNPQPAQAPTPAN